MAKLVNNLLSLIFSTVFNHFFSQLSKNHVICLITLLNKLIDNIFENFKLICWHLSCDVSMLNLVGTVDLSAYT